MLSSARGVLWVLVACLAACSPSVDYDGTEYRCDQSGTCPDGYRCVDGLCRSDRLADAGSDDDDDDDDDGDDPIDAREDSSAMLYAESSPDIDIPDDVDQGVVDAVHFEEDCTVTDLTVEVAISHDFPGDLVIELQSPSQTVVRLHDPGNSGEGGGDGIFGVYPTSLEPAESLDSFIGDEADGPWLLWVADIDDGDVGTLYSWAVTVWCSY